MERKALSIEEINEIMDEVTPLLKSDTSISVSTAVYEGSTKYSDPAWMAAHPKVFDKSGTVVDDAFRAKVSDAINEKYKDPKYVAKKKAAGIRLRIPKEIHDQIYARCFGADRGGVVYRELAEKHGIDLNTIADIARGKHAWSDKEKYREDIATWESQYKEKGGVTFATYQRIYARCFTADRRHPVAMYRRLAVEFRVSEGAIGNISRGNSPWTDKQEFEKDVVAWNERYGKN